MNQLRFALSGIIGDVTEPTLSMVYICCKFAGMFRRFIEHQLSRVRQCPQAGMLGDRVYERLEDALKRIVELIAGSTTTHMVSQAVTGNPFATAFPDLITDAERAQALDTIRGQLDSGAMTLPEPLVECLELQLGNMTSAFLEALDRLVEHRDEICDALLAGRRFQTIDDVALSTGDTHNCGRSVTVFHTDAGKLVYGSASSARSWLRWRTPSSWTRAW